MGRTEFPALNTDCERALVGYGTCLTRANWRSLQSAYGSVDRKEVDTADIVRETMLRLWAIC